MLTRRPSVAMFAAIAVLPLVVLGLPETRSDNAVVSEEHPVLRLDVSNFINSQHELDQCIQCVRIAFLDDDLLALTFMTSGSSKKAQVEKSPSHSGPTLFRTIFLDVKNGQTRATHEWLSATPSFAFEPTHDGQFLLTTPDEIKLYSPSFELLGHRELPPKGPGSAFSHAIVSWSGHTLTIKSYQGRQTRLDLVDADSLQVMQSWTTAEAVISFAAADNAVAIETHNQIQLSANDEPWRTVYSLPAPRSCTNQFIRPAFIGNDGLVFRDCNNLLVGIDTSGQMLFKSELFPSHTTLDPFTSSRNGSIFGALAYKSYCAASRLECRFDPIQGAAPERAIVYDARSGRPIYERHFPVDRKRPLGEIALSPHGSMLAVLSKVSSGRADGIVEVFQLPAMGKLEIP
jgi:hypothetical protein